VGKILADRKEVTMQYRTLGRTGLRVSLAGLGTGGASQLGQNTGRTDAESLRVVHAALDLGINLLDTSAAYKRSEELLGGALESVPRDRYVIATKFQPQRDGQIKTPEAVMLDLETSLGRLGVDYLDVWQYHGVPTADYRAIIDRLHPTVLRAQEQGKVRFVGITETVAGDAHHDMLPLALEEDLFDTLMIKYGILNQSAEERVFPMVLEHNVGVLVMASVRTSLRNPAEAVKHVNGFIQQGLLAMPSVTEKDPLGLSRAGAGPIPGLTQAAYQFAAAHPAVSTVLIGTGNPEHLRANVADLFAPGLNAARLDYLHRTYTGLDWTA
jgi:aryl-alcohol dehydrogenase-like predicted oxidoreductase